MEEMKSLYAFMVNGDDMPDDLDVSEMYNYFRTQEVEIRSVLKILEQSSSF